MIRSLDLATSILATVARLGSGASVRGLGARPEKTLELYDFESCPFCRKAREALSILDLEAMVLPCPKRGPRFRPQLIRRGGKAQFPYLIDPNSGVEMYESNDIVSYLFSRYGSARPPILLRRGPHNDLTTALASMARPFLRGRLYRRARAPQEPLELYSYEASPSCRIVRETLTSLELPYRLLNVAKGSPRRASLVERSGKTKVPYLIDPNTGTEICDPADIVTYLERTYALSA